MTPTQIKDFVAAQHSDWRAQKFTPQPEADKVLAMFDGFINELPVVQPRETKWGAL